MPKVIYFPSLDLSEAEECRASIEAEYGKITSLQAKEGGVLIEFE